MEIWVEFLLLFAGIKPLKPMLLQGLHQYPFRHLEPVIEVRQLFVAVFFADLIGRYCFDCAFEVVDRFQQILRKSRYGKVACIGNVSLRSVLKIAEIGDGAEVFVLHDQR